MSLVDVFKHLCSYLNVYNYSIDRKNGELISVKCGERTINGMCTALKYVTRECSRKELLGDTPEKQAVVGQWLEFCVSVLHRTSKSDLPNLLENLNKYLEDKVYFSGNTLSLADLVLYVYLHPVMNNLTFQEKQCNLHLSRWFNQVQHVEGVRRDLKELCFQKNYIYNKWTH